MSISKQARTASSARARPSRPPAVSPIAPADPEAEETPALEGMMGYLLRRANSMYHQYWSEKFFLPGGTLTPMQAGMLVAIHEWGPIAQTDLAHRMKIKLPSALHSTNHLEALRYVTRSVRAEDRRSYTLGLTEAGRAALRAVAAMAPVRDAELLAALSPAERDQLRSLLTRVVLGKD